MHRRLLLTPGPLTTEEGVREAMLHDHGSRDARFTALTAELRARLLAALGVPGTGTWSAVPIQGSGTFAIEACLCTLVPRDGTLLVLENGSYGRRMTDIAERIGLRVQSWIWDETTPIVPEEVAEALEESADITHIAVVHCETTTGLLNPVEAIAEVATAKGRTVIVDAMSSFGSIGVDLTCIDAVIASSNKGLEGPPGLGFVLVRESALLDCDGQASSLALDLYDQWARFELDGQWRFTPPTHVVAATVEALRRHAGEGGTPGRGMRYRENLDVLREGMIELGFQPLLDRDVQAPVIVTFLEPDGERWSFRAFYRALEARGFVIYPGKLIEAPSFRVGCIGAIGPDDMRAFVAAVADVKAELGLQ